ncbi:MAG: hypothetical protein WC385_01880 [Candidatus Paceibacterota bacterium]|jgi:hypothetical protein
MVLTPHAVVGAAIASAFNLTPGAAFVAGFASHFLLDSIPHWDYDLKASSLDNENPLNDDIPISRKAIGDWIKIFFDLFLGFFLAITFFTGHGQITTLTSLLWGAFGGILPDGFQFLAMKFKLRPLVFFHRFHILMCSPIKIKNTIWGPLLQALVLLLALILGNWTFFIL